MIAPFQNVQLDEPASSAVALPARHLLTTPLDLSSQRLSVRPS
jgi:hypothetical protein